MDRLMVGRTNGRMLQRALALVKTDGHTNGQMNVWTDEWVDKRRDGRYRARWRWQRGWLAAEHQAASGGKRV